MKAFRLSFTPRRILIINIARIGDTLLNTPTIRALRVAFPQATLVVMAHAKRKDILEHNPDIDVLISYSPLKLLASCFFRVKSYDLVIVYGRDPHIFRYARRIGHFLVGFQHKSLSINSLLNMVVPETPSSHAVEFRLQLVKAIGVEDADPRLRFFLSPEEIRWADGFLRRHGLANAALRIGFQVAGFPTKAYRDYPAEHFITLGRLLLAEMPARVILFGGKEDRKKARVIKATLGDACISVAGETTLRQSAALLNNCAAFITTDTGMMHLAFALEVPTVALFHCLHSARGLGPTSRPEIHRLLQMEPPPGIPCTRELSMDGVSPEVVFNNLQSLLKDLGLPR